MVNEKISDAIMLALSKYADFSGRARRAEYWYYVLFTNIFFMVVSFVSPHNCLLLALLLLIPNLAIAFRRIHDINRSAWWLLIGLIPLVGSLVLLYWFVQPGTVGPNQFGLDPLQKLPTQNTST